MHMLRLIYLSPIGPLISIALNAIRSIYKPFMVYGYWDRPSKKFRRHTRISSTTSIINKKNIEMSDYCWVGHYSVLDGSNGIKIGEGVQLAFWVGIFSHGSEISIRLYGKKYITTDKSKRIGYKAKPVTIGDYTYIGSGACILPGTNIGKGCLIAAGAIVNRDIPDFSIVSGVPAQVVGSTLDIDKKYFDDPAVQESYFDPIVIANFLETKSD